MSLPSSFLLMLSMHIFEACSSPIHITTDQLRGPTASVNNGQAHHTQGWTAQPSTRGTLDIIWSCGFTMFLCSWSVLCLNVAGPDDTTRSLLLRKLYLTTLGFAAPELITTMAMGQWISARRSVKDFHESKYPDWSMRHAFFADMGGFMLRTRDWPMFPIDAKQLHYLVTKKYIILPNIHERKIKDKNKVDGLLRAITVCQTLWFVVDISGRAAQGLVITCGELTTASFIVCSIGTTFFWLRKPADVFLPEVLETDMTIAEILLEAGEEARDPYLSRTPLDFVSRQEWHWSICWSNFMNILRTLHIEAGSRIRPVNRFENSKYLKISPALFWVCFGLTAVYCAILISGWNFEFPTRLEQILWRVATITLMGVLLCLCTLFYLGTLRDKYPGFFQHFLPFLSAESRFTHRSRERPEQGFFMRSASSAAAWITNNSVSKDPQLTLQLREILPIYLLGIFYIYARAYVFLADVIQLRALPPTAYLTVNWSSFVPHF